MGVGVGLKQVQVLTVRDAGTDSFPAQRRVERIASCEQPAKCKAKPSV